MVLAIALWATAAAAPVVGPGSPGGVPADIDCAVREYAWEYGKSLLPREGSFVSLFDALQLSENCGKARPLETKVAAPVYAPGENAIYVDANTGNDAAAGTSLDSALRTLEAGVAKARVLLKGGASRVTVNLREGTHYLSDTVTIGPELSGLVIQNHNGEEATVSGGVPFKVEASAWSQYKQGKYWDVQMSANNVFGQVPSPGANTSTIKFIGVFDTPEGCRNAAQQGAFNSYTYHEASFGADYRKHCYGRTDMNWAVTKDDNVESGFFVTQNVWKASIPKDVDITEIPGLRLNGARMIRAKYPNGDPEQSGHFLQGFNAGMGGGDYVEGWVPLSAGVEWVPPRRKPDSEEVVITAADWPEVEWPMSEAGGSGWTGEGDWGEFHAGYGGYCDDLDPPFGYWCAMHPPRGQCWDKKTNKGHGCTQTHMSPDGVVFPRAQNYSKPVGAVLHAWRGGGRWFTQQWLVDGWVPENNTLTFDPTTGSQGGEGMTTGGQFWIENVLEEVDSANEYFFDEENRVLYFQPNTTGSPGDTSFVATKHRVLFNISGSFPDKITRNTAVRGMTLRDTRYTYLDIHGMPSGGDWALQRSGAVYIEAAEGVDVSGNVLVRLDGNAVSINGYVRNLTVSENDFSWIGDSAMAAWGHTSECLNANCSKKLPAKVGPDGRGGEQPRGVVVSSNLVRELGIYQKQSSMWFQAVTAQTQLKNNVHFNGPRAGVNFNDGFGGGDVMSGNLLANCVRESGDHGPFNSWDRLPYITTIKTGKPSIIPEWRELTKNFVISNYASQEAIDTDDGSSYYKTHDNAFIYAANGLKSDFGGHDNQHFRNLYTWVSNCWGGGNSDHFVNNTCIANSNTGGFASDCKQSPLMEVSGNKIYNQAGSLSAKICDASNVVAGKWPSPDEVVAMIKAKLA